MPNKRRKWYIQTTRWIPFTSTRTTSYGKELTTLTDYTPESNELANRTNRSLLDKMRAMLQHKGLDSKTWKEVKRKAVYIHNRAVTLVQNNRFTHEATYDTSPDNSNIWMVGCTIHAYEHKQQKHTWSSREETNGNLWNPEVLYTEYLCPKQNKLLSSTLLTGKRKYLASRFLAPKNDYIAEVNADSTIICSSLYGGN